MNESPTADDRLESVKDYLEQTLAEDNPGDYTRVLFYLLNEIKEQPYPYRTVLNHLFQSILSEKSRESLEEIVNHVVRDTKSAENDSEYAKFMSEMYELMLSNDDGDSLMHDGGGGTGIMNKPEAYLAVTTYMVQAMSRVPKESWAKLFQALETDVAGTMVAPLAKTGAVISEAGGGGTLATVKLMAVHLSWKTIRNIYMWWEGEISGTRCAKNIMEELAATAGGVAGGYVGSQVGFYVAGPIGALVGGLGGGIWSYSAASKAADRFLLNFFDLPRDYALENAYNFLGVHREAENAAVNHTYRRLARKYHPDMRGGDDKKFMALQYYMQIIKAHRGE